MEQKFTERIILILVFREHVYLILTLFSIYCYFYNEWVWKKERKKQGNIYFTTINLHGSTSPTSNYALHVYKNQVENLFLKFLVGTNVQIKQNHLQTLNFKEVGGIK